MRLIFIFILIIMQGVSFKETQLRHSRVKNAYAEKEKTVDQYFVNKKLIHKGSRIFIRAFKKEEALEVWISEKGKQTFSLLHSYEFCSSSGTLGPKRKEGDLQIPEGIYHINHFNPQSNFHLSLGINYPNSSDKILSDKRQPGGAIYIHGNCVTIGCIPITDDKIKELYVLAVEAKNSGQDKIPVHIFPARLDQAGISYLKNNFDDAEKITFWENLKVIYESFEKTKTLKEIRVDSNGRYLP